MEEKKFQTWIVKISQSHVAKGIFFCSPNNRLPLPQFVSWLRKNSYINQIVSINACVIKQNCHFERF